MDRAYVYHIKDPSSSDINCGYIGVVKADKGVFKRFREHCRTIRMGGIISRHSVTFDMVEILFEGTRAECQALEKRLRPLEKMGWNLASGGSGYNYSKIEDISKFRSELQTKRMQDESLKKRQSETFKDNYYNDDASIALRKLRAIEHMGKPSSRTKCLSAMHKKIACPICGFETNHGNMKRHIKSKHDNQTC